MRRYGGENADRYDDARRHSPRFEAEESAFRSFMHEIKPSGVLDCPFGTGRWLPYYGDIPGPVLGVDLSEDMLKVARSKVTDPAPNLQFVQADIFHQPFTKYSNRGITLVVCTRFLNWFPAEKALLALTRLGEVNARYAIIGASLRPVDARLFSSTFARWRLQLDNARRRRQGAALQYVHDEAWLLECFERLGWQVRQRRFIFTNPTRTNFFFLLEKVAA